MFIPKEILQAIVFATIIGIFIVLGFAIYSPKTSFDACVDRWVDREIRNRYTEKNRKLTKDKLQNLEDLGWHYCRK